jgi:hypothetical protein
MSVVIHRHGRNYGKRYGTTPPSSPLKPSNHLINWNYQKRIREREMLMGIDGRTVWDPDYRR